MIVLLLGLSAHAANAAPTVDGNKAYLGYSHDIKQYALNGTLTNGPIVAAGVGCSDRPTLFYQDSAASVTLGGISMGNVVTSSHGSKSGTIQKTESIYQTEDLVLPIGTAALTADAVTVTSTTTYDTATGAFTMNSTMVVANLEVRLLPVLPPIVDITGSVSKNFGVTVPGIATLVLHASEDQGGTGQGAGANFASAVKVDLIGGTVRTTIGEMASMLYGDTDQNWMFGAGEGLRVSAIDEALTVGPLVTAQLPCSGNGGVTSTVLGVNGLPASLGSLGAITSTATGTRSGLTADATTTSEVAGVNLAGGLVTATAVKSTSHVSTTDGAATVSKAGSGTILTDLVIAGVPINANAAPNTVINLPLGAGYVVVNSQTVFSAGIEVIPLVVHLNTGNVDIIVARSFAFLLGPNTGVGALKQAQRFLDKAQTEDQKLGNTQKLLKDTTKSLGFKLVK